MLTTWLIELFLNELGGLRDEGDMSAHHKLQQQFHKFLEGGDLRVSKHTQSYEHWSNTACIISKLFSCLISVHLGMS